MEEKFDDFIISYVHIDDLNFLTGIDEFNNYNWDFDKIIPNFVLSENKEFICKTN